MSDIMPVIGVKLIIDGLTEFTKGLGSTRSILSQVAQDALRAANAVNGIGDASVQGATSSVDKLGSEADNTAKQINRLDQEMSEAQDTATDMASESGKGASALGSVADIAMGAYARLGEIVTDKLLGALMTAQKFVTEAPAIAGKFQEVFLKFSAAANLDPAQVEGFRKAFLQLGKDLPISTNEAVQAATELAKGGITGNVEFMAAITEQVAKFGLAGEMSLTQAAETFVKVMGTFTDSSMSAEEKLAFVTEASNSLVQSANTSTVGVMDLNDALLAAGGSSKAIGQPLDEMIAALGIIAPSFGSSAEAGTSYKNFLQRLVPTSMEARKMMFELGLMTDDYAKISQKLVENGIKPQGESIDELKAQYHAFLKESRGLSDSAIAKEFDMLGKNAFFVDGKLRPLNEISQILQDTFKNMSAEQRISAMTTIFQTEAMQTANALMDKGASGIDEYKKQMGSALDVQGQFAATFQGLNAASTNLEGSVESLQIQIGDYFLPALEQWENIQNSLVNATGGLIAVIMQEEGALQALPVALKPIGAFFDTGVKALQAWGTSLAPAFQPLVDLGPIISDSFARIGQSLQPLINDVMEVAAAFGGNEASLGEVVRTVLESIVLIISEAVKLIVLILEGLAFVIKVIWDQIGQEITMVVIAAWNVISMAFQAIVVIVSDVVNAILALFQGDFAGAFDYAKHAVQTFVWGAGLLLVQLGGYFLQIAGEIIKTIGNLVFEIAAAFVGLGISLTKWVISFFPDWRGEFIDSMKIPTEILVNDMLRGWYKGFNNFMDKAIQQAKDFANSIIDVLGDMFKFGSPSKLMMQFGEWTAEGFAIGMKMQTPAVIQSTRGMVDGVTQPMMQSMSTMNNVVNNYSLGVTTSASPTQVVRSYEVMKGSI